jgi:ABC-type hemin transport system ATPase subunit
LPIADSISASPAVAAAPNGLGYLTLSDGKQGKIKLAGVLADGTKVSKAATLLALDESGNEASKNT